MATIRVFKRVFDVRKQEWPVVLVLFLFLFVVVGVFQILKPLKNGLFLQQFGAGAELQAKAITILLGSALSLSIAGLLRSVARERFLCFIAILFSICLLLVKTASSWFFYLLGDLWIALLLPFFWAYLTEICSPEQTRRFLAVVGAGGVLGGWTGSAIVKQFLPELGMEGILNLTAMILSILPCLILACHRVKRPVMLQESLAGESLIEGFRGVLSSKFMLSMVGIIACYEIASQLIDYQFKLSLMHFGAAHQTQALLGDAYFYANLLSLFAQCFLSNAIQKRFGWTVSLLILPLAVIAGSVGFLAMPGLLFANLLIISDNGLSYSTHQVFLPREERRKHGVLANLIVQRLAKVIGITFVIALQNHLFYIPLLVILVMLFAVACTAKLRRMPVRI